MRAFSRLTGGMLAGTLLALSGPAHAAAFYLQEQSAKGAGRANSGEVSEQGAQQMWWNPAAIGGIAAPEGFADATAILPSGDARDTGTLVARPGLTIPGGIGILASVVPVGGQRTAHDPVDNGVLPTGGFAIPIGSRFAVGIVATSPFSFTTDYDADSWARYNADRTRLRTYDLQPVVAFVPLPGLSVGAGPNIEYVRATLSNALPDPLSPAFPDGHQALKGSGWDVGWSAGAQYHNPLVDLGISYKSAITHRLKGRLTIDGIADPLAAVLGLNQTIDHVRATFELPWQLDFGARVHVTPLVTLQAQIVRFGWSRFDAIRIGNLGALDDQALPENYHDSWSFAGGAEFRISPTVTLRGGVQRDRSPIRDADRDPRVPDGNRWDFALGGSYRLNPLITLDAAANYDKIESGSIEKVTAAYAGTPLQTVILTSGELRDVHALIFSVGARFGF